MHLVDMLLKFLAVINGQNIEMSLNSLSKIHCQTQQKFSPTNLKKNDEKYSIDIYYKIENRISRLTFLRHESMQDSSEP